MAITVTKFTIAADVMPVSVVVENLNPGYRDGRPQVIRKKPPATVVDSVPGMPANSQYGMSTVILQMQSYAISRLCA